MFRALVIPLVCSLCAAAQNVLTYHNDLARTGQNLEERVLNRKDVNPASFGRLFTYPVDGQVYAQPLFVSRLALPGQGTHDVVFVATEHDSVYAFDADGGGTLWHTSFINPAASVMTVSSPASTRCAVLAPEIGITGTPVVDLAPGTLYVVASTFESLPGASSPFVHRLHALDIGTGSERPGSPVVIEAEGFSPDVQLQRAGLALANGVVYTLWSSHCDHGLYHGWILGYDARTLKQTAVYNSTPGASSGAFWASGAAPAIDAEGNLYAISGNGDFNAHLGGTALSDSFIKLSTKGGLSLLDYFTPFNVFSLNVLDLDLGSSGAVLLPDEAGGVLHPHLMVSAGKEGRIYVVDRDNPGRYQADSDSQIVQSLHDSIQPLFGAPAYFNRTLYFASINEYPKAFAIRDGLLAPASQGSEKLDFPGAVPSISAHGTSDGIMWIIDSSPSLRAYDADDLSKELFRGRLDSYVKFSVPTIAKGKVFAGTQNSLSVFGLLPARRKTRR